MDTSRTAGPRGNGAAANKVRASEKIFLKGNTFWLAVEII